MPLPVVKTATGRRLVLAESAPADTGRAVAYCRVSSAEQKIDLERQAGRVAAEATALGLTTTELALTGIRRSRASWSSTVTGWPALVSNIWRARCKPPAVASSCWTTPNLADDLVRDMTQILTSFCARLYGRRSASRKAKAAIVAVEVTP